MFNIVSKADNTFCMAVLKNVKNYKIVKFEMIN